MRPKCALLTRSEKQKKKKNIENFANIISKFQHVQQTFSNLTYLLNSAHVGKWTYTTHAHAYIHTHCKKKKVKHICLLKRDLLGKMVLRVRENERSRKKSFKFNKVWLTFQCFFSYTQYTIHFNMLYHPYIDNWSSKQRI